MVRCGGEDHLRFHRGEIVVPDEVEVLTNTSLPRSDVYWTSTRRLRSRMYLPSLYLCEAS